MGYCWVHVSISNNSESIYFPFKSSILTLGVSKFPVADGENYWMIDVFNEL